MSVSLSSIFEITNINEHFLFFIIIYLSQKIVEKVVWISCCAAQCHTLILHQCVVSWIMPPALSLRNPSSHTIFILNVRGSNSDSFQPYGQPWSTRLPTNYLPSYSLWLRGNAIFPRNHIHYILHRLFISTTCIYPHISLG